MAGKKTNGHDPSTDRIVEVLERIEKRIELVERGLVAVREELHGFRTETRDELLDLHAGQHQLRMELKGSIEARIAKLEAAVFRPTGT